MKTKAVRWLAPAVVVGGILAAWAWTANAQEPAASAATTTTTSGGVASVTTSDGKIFTDVKVLRVRGDQALLSNSDGMTWVALDSLSDDARKSLGLPTRQEQTAFDEKLSGHPGLPRLRGMDSPSMCSDDDVRVLGTEWKANVIRWYPDLASLDTATSRDLPAYDRWLAGKLDELDKTLDACRRYGMKLVVLLLEPGGRHSNQDTAMLYEPQYQDHWVAAWEKIARRYKGNSTIWGYDLTCEPVQRAPLPQGMPDCLGAQARAAKAIREIDPDMPIFIEVADWDLPWGYKNLKPVAISNVIYEVHMYEPHEFTHQGVLMWEKYFPAAYPGKIAGAMWDKQQLRRALQPVRDFQLAHHVGVFVGEFSAIRWAPGVCNWLRDSIALFEEYGWDWTYWAYCDWNGWSVDHGSNKEDNQPAQEPTDRKKLLLSWFAKNVQPPREAGAPAKP